MIRTLLALFALAVTTPVLADEKDCRVWAEYTAKSLMGSMSQFGAMNMLYVPKDAGTMGMGAHTIPFLTDEVKNSFKADQKALVAKYQEVVLAHNNAQAEMYKDADKPVGNGGGMFTGVALSPAQMARMNELNKKASAAAESYKKDLLAYGGRNNCGSALDSAIAQEQFKQNQAMNQFNLERIKAKTAQVTALKKERHELLSSLEECKVAAPSIAGKLTKQLQDIRNKIKDDAAKDCPNCATAGTALDHDIF